MIRRCIERPLPARMFVLRNVVTPYASMEHCVSWKASRKTSRYACGTGIAEKAKWSPVMGGIGVEPVRRHHPTGKPGRLPRVGSVE